MTGPARLFGAELRRRRLTAGLSLEAMAKQVNYTKGYLSKIETGSKPASVDLARRFDAALAAGGELAALVGPRRVEAARQAAGVDDAFDDGEDEVWILMTPNGAVVVPVSRRQALAMGGVALAGLGIGLGTRSAAGPGMASAAEADSTLAGFRRVFEEIRRLGRTVSPASVLPTIASQTQSLRGLAEAAAGAARTRLVKLASRHAEYAGWMAQEAGDERMAVWWTAKAVDLAHAAGDDELAAYALVRRANITLYRDDAVATIELARLAREQPGISARVQGLAAQREAQGHALNGDYDACARALDAAADLLDRPAAPSEEPPLGSSSVPGLSALVRGWCLYDLGRTREAAAVLDQEVPRIAADSARSAARFGARRALAHAASGDLDHACDLVEETLALAGPVDSATIRLDLRRFAQTARRWQSRPRVRELQPRLAAALRSTDL
jgi:transcriptional regulator with XRE-family HTH domain